ncbi:MAG: IS110 family transposase [Gammaproteobacteria bacterium]
MDNVTHLGLDVHKETIAVAVLRPGELVPDERVIPNTPEALRKLISRSPRRLATCYEAGPTGYDTHRLLTSLGVPCDVIAPTLTPRRAGQRVKTDRLDARMLARLHRAGELTPIRVPSPEEEAVRDLVRVREDLKDDRKRARQRLRSFLLRYGRRHEGSGRWTLALEAWARSQKFDEPYAQAAYDHLLASEAARTAELLAADARVEQAATAPPLDEPVARLRCLRGVDTLTAVTIVAEVCDFRRFPTAPSFMSFTGLVPSEHSSGASERRGSITKTGNRHVRRVLVEAAWAYRHRPAIGSGLRRRSEGQPPEVLACAWRAQLRLNARYRLLAPKKGREKAVTAVARELAGFVWALTTDRL